MEKYFMKLLIARLANTCQLPRPPAPIYEIKMHHLVVSQEPGINPTLPLQNWNKVVAYVRLNTIHSF